MNKNKEKNPLVIIILFFIGLVAVGYISLIAGAYALNNEDVVLLNAFLQVPELIKANPLGINPINTDALMFGEVIYIIACMFAYAQASMNKKTAPGCEFGTAAFMTKGEIKAWRKKFMNKQTYTEGLPSAQELEQMNKKN